MCTNFARADLNKNHVAKASIDAHLKNNMSKKKVCYYYDDEVGNYYYGCGHPMVCSLRLLLFILQKPHRIRMTHNLLLNYGLYKKLYVYVCLTILTLAYFQRPTKAKATDMSRFHTDEYVKFLETVTPENMDAYAKQLIRCVSHSLLCDANLQIMLVRIAPSLMACFSFVRFLLVVQWVRSCLRSLSPCHQHSSYHVRS